MDLQRQITRLKSKRRIVEQAIFALEDLAREYGSREAGPLRNRWIVVSANCDVDAAPSPVIRLRKLG